jgi:MAGUK p55 subfamily protein 5
MALTFPKRNAAAQFAPVLLQRAIISLQEALRKRKEEEDRVAQQNEFLNRSVRGSRKLQALESHSTPQSPSGVVNDGYSSAEEADLAPPPAAEDDSKPESLHRVIGEYCTALSVAQLLFAVQKYTFCTRFFITVQ